MRYTGLIDRYRELLPVTPDTPKLTLHEGNTPLIRADKLSARLDLDIYFKFEGMNPTGSFKDRGMVMAVAKAMEEGSRTIMCASTGNTSAAAAAYAARGGLACVVLIPNGNIALGKLAQAYVYGATVLAIDGNFDRALEIVRDITANHPITLVNSVNPYRLEGQKTAAFEIVDALGSAPEYLAIPVGNAGNISAYWKGFKQYRDVGRAASAPKMIGFQAAGASPLVTGKPFPNPETVATAIRIGNPASWELAVAAYTESGGGVWAVTDEEILEAYRTIAAVEGVFAEPASAASIAGVIKRKREGGLPSGSRVVCVLTGHGLKDPGIAIKTVAAEPTVVPATEDAVLSAIARAETVRG